MSTTAKVFVGSLPPGCKPEELRHLFTSYGVVVECDVMNRCGFVHMESSNMADAAIAALNGIEFKGQAIVVEAGRPKDRKGPGGAGNRNRGPGVSMNRRPMPGHGGNPNNGPPAGGGGNFNRGGGNNNFRGGSAGGGNRGQNFSNGNSFGPVRRENNNRQQRSAPYTKGPSEQNSDGPPQGGFKNKFSQGLGGGKFGGGGSGNFSNTSGGRFGGNANNQFSNWESQSSGGPGASNSSMSMNASGGRRNFKNSPSGGFGGNSSNNDFHSGNSIGGGGGMGNQRGSSGPGSSNNVAQDRRGFALPAVEHQQQQQLPFGGQQGRFGNGPLMQSGNSSDNGFFQRRNNPGSNSGNPQGGRGGFNSNRGGFSGRGGFNARRGDGPNDERNMSQNQGGGFNNRGGSGNAINAYQSDFPPLGSGLGNRNRNDGPRPNMPVGNRRY